MGKQLFEYAIILQEEKDGDDKIVEQAKILVEPILLLADSIGEVNIKAARAIPDEHLDHLDRVDLVVRPF